MSDSTSIRLKDMQAAALAFIEQLRPEDRVILVTFDRRVQVVKIADELRRQYTLSYYPARASAPGQRRKIKVRVTREKVSVRSRKTYVSGRAAGK